MEKGHRRIQTKKEGVAKNQRQNQSRIWYEIKEGIIGRTSIKGDQGHEIMH